MTLKADLDNWGENFKLLAVDKYNKDGNNIVASVYYDKRTGLGYFEKDLEAGKDYYVLSKQDGTSFTILKAEVIQ